MKNRKGAKFNMSGDTIELSEKEEVGIIYKNIYYLNKCFSV